MARAASRAPGEPIRSALVGPTLPRVLVPRPQLLSVLQAAPGPLTVLRAPLGFGKTTLVAQRLRDRQGKAEGAVGWLRISPDIADPERFWSALFETVAEALRAYGGPVAPLIGSAEPSRARLRQAVARASGRLTLVLDDVDRLPVGIDHELLMILRDSPSLRLTVCLRGHRHFRPALYVDLDHTTLTADELRFTLEETERLLGLCEVPSPRRRAVSIHSETGGWPELTRACVLALQPRPGSASPASSRDDTDIVTAVTAACLHDRLLPAMGDSSLVNFAVSTSILDAVPTELAALIGPADADAAHDWLARLAAEGMLTGPDARHGAYRWPPAARRALYQEAVRRDADRVLNLHRVATDWLLDHDQPEPALRQAIQARDWPLVVRVIEARWEDLYLTARQTLIAAIKSVPEGVADSRLLFRIVRSLILATTDHALLETLPTLPEDPAQLKQLGGEPDAVWQMRVASAVMVTLRVRGHHVRASQHGERLTILAETVALEHSADAAPRLPGLLLQVGITHLFAGNLTPAHRALRRAYDLAPHSSSPHIARDSAGKLALLLSVQGHANRAALWLDRYDAAPRAQGWLGDQVSASGLLARAWTALDLFDLPAAARTLSEIDSDVIGGYEVPMMIAYLEALHRLHTRRADEALHELSRVTPNQRVVHEPGSLPVALAESVKAELLLALGRGNHARAAIQTMPEHPLMRIPHARMLLLGGDPAAAIGLANDFGWLQSAPPRLVVEMLLIKAVAHHRNGQPATATATLGNAISAAAANRLRRPFATFPHDELLVIATGLPPETGEFLRHPSLAAATPPFPARVELVHLTDRERLILTRLSSDDRVQDIAADLFLSYNTVRSYLRDIYKKLAANSREQAVAHARAYGLIAS
jgi:LuxR family maltose regulon positive regulatory protein